jgi:hypothetical protein
VTGSYPRLNPGLAGQLRLTFSRTGRMLLGVGIAFWVVTALLAYPALMSKNLLAPFLISSGSTGGLLVLLSGISLTNMGRQVNPEWVNVGRIRTGLRVLLLNVVLTFGLAVIIGYAVVTLADDARATTAQVIFYLVIPALCCVFAAAGFFVARNSMSQIRQHWPF